MNVNEAIKNRRTYYGISNEVTLSKDRIKELIENAVNYSPSAFNSQGSNVLVLFGEHHLKLWNIAKECLRKVVPADAFAATEKKLDSFAAGYGTVLFFEDMTIVKNLQEKYALYKDNFPVWASQSNGMLQYVVWTSLEAEGLGVSLQHYNPLIDDEVKNEWKIPESWVLVGQMPFGSIVSGPGEKEYKPISERMKVFE